MMMRNVRMIALGLLLLVALGPVDAAQSGGAGEERVVLVTLDGARWQEIFGGLDADVLQSTLRKEQGLAESASYRRLWAASREERRRKLMPFFWSLVTEQGSIAGDGDGGTPVRLRNRHKFSYPGYAEILLGEANDEVINSNDARQSPFTTVMETLRTRLNLSAGQVATFASWPVFNQIAERVPGATFVNAGIEPLDNPAADVQVLNRLQTEVATPWTGTRFDAFTFHLAMAHLAAERPRVLYIAFDETDDWAHDGRYDLLLEAYVRIDGYLQRLWTWLQSQPDYRGRTHLLITTDHGRGRTPADWRRHGADVAGAEEVWMAFVSPRMSQRGVWRDGPPLSTSQVAATLASWMGVDWNADHPAAGTPVR
jgi:hypothetical protein